MAQTVFVLFANGEHQITVETATLALAEFRDLKDMECDNVKCLRIESDDRNTAWQIADLAEEESRVRSIGRKWIAWHSIENAFSYAAPVAIKHVGVKALDDEAKLELIAETRQEVLREIASQMHNASIRIALDCPRKGFSVNPEYPLVVTASVNGRESHAMHVRDGNQALLVSNGIRHGLYAAYNGRINVAETAWLAGLSPEITTAEAYALATTKAEA